MKKCQCGGEGGRGDHGEGQGGAKRVGEEKPYGQK